MAYPYEFYKLTFGGEVYGGQDEWSCGLNFGFPSMGVGFEESDTAAAMSTIAAAIEEYFTSEEIYISNRADLRWIKLAGIGKDGLYFREPVIHDFPSPVPGMGNQAVFPQIALAVSFRSSRMRAPGKDARIFLPMPGHLVQNDGKLEPTAAAGIRTKTVELIQSLETALAIVEDDKPQLIVASQKTPENNIVQTVRVGRMFDTQRRRRNKFTEEYSGSQLIVRT